MFTLKKLKEITGLRGSNIGNGGILKHTFNVFEEFSMCHTYPPIT